jgi:hypothetical protein
LEAGKRPSNEGVHACTTCLFQFLLSP